MSYNNQAPKWDAVGVEPTDEIKETGFLAGYKPPAPTFNWFWHTVSECLKELQGHNRVRTYTALSQMGLTAGTETIAGIVAAMENGSQAIISIDANNNLAIYPKKYFGTLIVYKLSISRTILFFGTSSTNTLYYGNYYYANDAENWSGWLSYLNTDGGTLSGVLNFQKVVNGSGAILKNHSNSADYGMYISDEDADGKTAKLVLSAKNNKVSFIGNDGNSNPLYGAHNTDTLKTDIAHNQKVYTDLAQIGLTAGSETIETIATKLPTYSRLLVTVGADNNLSIYPNQNFGLLIVEKTVNTRNMYTFINNQGAVWQAVYAISASGNTWSGWKDISSTGASKDIYGDTTISLGRKSGTTVGTKSIAMGSSVTASGDYSFAAGNGPDATGRASTAFGMNTVASEDHAFACGMATEASGEYAFAAGYSTKAKKSQFALGHYNDDTLATDGYDTGTTGTAFVIGNGKTGAKSNALRVTYAGAVYAKSAYNATGADYAEFAEWADGNPDSEDRRGFFVTFDETKPNMIRKANAGEYILGIVSGNPCVIGNSDECWLGKYVYDEFGAIIYEEVEEEVEYIDETGETKTKTEKITTYKLNPEYDATREYIHRSDRPEWDFVGWIGVLSVRDDGTCVAGGYCKVADGGTATAAERGADTYRVLERVTDNVVKVALK